MFQPSAYQQAFFEELLSNRQRNIILEAKAGSGKTKSIEEALKLLPQDLRKSTLLTAFNTAIRDELLERQKRGKIPPEVVVSNIHQIGYRILAEHTELTVPQNKWVEGRKYNYLSKYYWNQYLTEDRMLLALQPKIELLSGKRKSDSSAKIWKAVERRIFEENKRNWIWDGIWQSERLTLFAMKTLTSLTDKTALLDMSTHFDINLDNELMPLILEALPLLVEWGQNGTPEPDSEGRYYGIDESLHFDEMVYLPVAMNLPLPQYQRIFCDEAQDLNRAQQVFLQKMIAPGGSLIAVGDKSQAIYGFSGSDHLSFERIAEIGDTVTLPLSICYRCPKAVIKHAQRIVPDIEYAEDAKEGEVHFIENEDLWDILLEHWANYKYSKFMVLCRTNAPLVSLAYSLIREGIPAKIRGREIGDQLVTTLEKIAKQRGFQFDEFWKFAEQYRRQQVEILQGRRGSEIQIAHLHDQIETLDVIYQAVREQGSKQVSDIKDYIKRLFVEEDKNAIQLSTVHKAKGLEAPRVAIIEANLMPHPMARMDWQQIQEDNLAYVALTRAKEKLYICGDFAYGKRG